MKALGMAEIRVIASNSAKRLDMELRFIPVADYTSQKVSTYGKIGRHPISKIACDDINPRVANFFILSIVM